MKVVLIHLIFHKRSVPRPPHPLLVTDSTDFQSIIGQQCAFLNVILLHCGLSNGLLPTALRHFLNAGNIYQCISEEIFPGAMSI